MAERRKLRFDSLDEAARDAERLLAHGYAQAGQWSLAQACGHMTLWLTYPIEGFPKPPFVLRPVFWTVQRTVGPKKLKGYLAQRSFPAGKPTMPSTVMPKGGDEPAAVGDFRKAVERLMAHNGAIVPSPVFGPMDKTTALALQCVHTAHHLSFLIPKTT